MSQSPFLPPSEPDKAYKAPQQPVWMRRNLLAFLGLALSAGAGVAWMANRAELKPQNQWADLWHLNFPTPTGGNLNLNMYDNTYIVLNFWATWCPPCIEELPLLEDFYVKNKHKNWQVVGLAVDQLAAVQHFLQKMPLSFPIGLAPQNGVEWARRLGNLSGGLPFSVVFDAKGSIVQRKIGRLKPEDLGQWLNLG